MAWNQLLFEDAVRNKMAVQQQGAAADTTRANAAAEDVGQRSALQQQADNAAQMRAQTVADNQALVTSMNNQSSQAVAGMTTQAQRDIAAMQDQGALARTQMTTGTQRDIAGQSLGFDREKLAQQGVQFGQTLGLDTAKAQESAIQGRATLATPEYGTPAYNYDKKQLETAIKRPAITGLAPSPLSTLGGGSSLATETDDELRKKREALAAALGQ